MTTHQNHKECSEVSVLERAGMPVTATGNQCTLSLYCLLAAARSQQRMSLILGEIV